MTSSAQVQGAQEGRPKPLMGKHVLELRVASDRLDLKKTTGTLRVEPAEGAPILYSLHYERPSTPEPSPPDASRRALPLGAGGPSVDLVVLRPPTDFRGMTGRKGRRSEDGRAAAGRAILFADLLFDRPDPRFKGTLTLDVDGELHSAEFDYPFAQGRPETK